MSTITKKEAPHQSRAARWPGAATAAKDLGVCHSHLYRVLKGERPSPPLIKRWNAWLKEHPEFAALQKKNPTKKSA